MSTSFLLLTATEGAQAPKAVSELCADCQLPFPPAPASPMRVPTLLAALATHTRHFSSQY